MESLPNRQLEASVPAPEQADSSIKETSVGSTVAVSTAETLLARTIVELQIHGVGQFSKHHAAAPTAVINTSDTVASTTTAGATTTTADLDKIKQKNLPDKHDEDFNDSALLDYTKSAFYSPAKAVIPRQRPKSKSAALPLSSFSKYGVSSIPNKRKEGRDAPCDDDEHHEKQLIRALHYSTEVLVYNKNHLNYKKSQKGKPVWISNVFNCGHNDVDQLTETMGILAEKVPYCGPMNQEVNKKKASTVLPSNE